MEILIVTPAPPGSRVGNNVTAVRWARLLRELGHRAQIARTYSAQRPDAMIALHARKSAESVARFKSDHPDRPLVLCLTGTDIYLDYPESAEAARSIALADRIVCLQPLALLELPEAQRAKATTIFQSSAPPRRFPKKRKDVFEVCVSGHLREVKDPFRAAEASKLLGPRSKVRILQVGGALSPEMARRAAAEERRNPRYRWIGELPRWRARLLLARSRLMVISSLVEGGANVVSEAIVCKVPVLASRIPGNVGLLGEDYPGYFEPKDSVGLATLLARAEKEPRFLEELSAFCARLEPAFHREAEREAWRSLLERL